MNSKSLRIVIVGLGVQGMKRMSVAGSDIVATVDPAIDSATYKSLYDVPSTDYDAALLCVPDGEKLAMLSFLIGNGKHVLVEKPIISSDEQEISDLSRLAQRNNVVCYTAYNHRFEPHFVRMRDLIASGDLGKIYSLRMFYGNGTARLVRESAWRDTGAGVLTDLGSHLLDTLRFWFGDGFNVDFRIQGAHRHENRAFDHIVVTGEGYPAIQLEMSMLSWRNHFTCDIYAENGSAHIDSLCKWGPSTFTRRTRILPSGRPPEESVCLVQTDPTWETEYVHFVELCRKGTGTTLDNDLWLSRKLNALARQTGLTGTTEKKGCQ